MHARSLRWFALLLISTAGFAQQSTTIASQIAVINRSLEARPQLARPSRGEASPTLLNVLQVRQKLVEQLIRTDPGLVRSVMLPPTQADALRSESAEYAAAIESDTSWSGTLSAAVADDFEHGISTTHWHLQSGDRRIELFFVGNDNPMQHLHRSVSVRGVATARVMSVEGLHAEITTGQFPGLNCTPTGAENTAVVVMEQPSGGQPYPVMNYFDDPTAWPWPQDYFSGTPNSTNAYWQESSFGRTSATGEVIGPYTFTSSHDCTDTDALETDALNVLSSNSVDLSKYSRISVIFPVMSCSFGGLGTIGCNAVSGYPNHPFSFNWIPVRKDYTETFPVFWGLISHELGHNLGLNHSSSLQFGTTPLGAIDYVDNNGAGGTGSPSVGARVEYGDPYTIMGNGSYNCFGQYTAFNKAEYLTWMNRSSDVNEITNGGGSFKIVPFENSSGLRALRILRDPLTSSWLWLEYRQALGNYDSNLSTCIFGGSNVLSGASVYYESPYSQDGHLFLLDMNVSNSTSFDIHNGALTPGTAWSDPYSLLTLSATSADSTGINITASYDQPCATLSTPSVFPAAGGSGSITVNVTSTPCPWSASTVDSWISNVSPASGTTSGMVSFNVASNTGSGFVPQRNGYITIQRQSVPVVQKGTNTFISNLSPILQSGTSGVPVFTFNDPAGLADINYVTMKIHGSDCFVEVTQSSGSWFMFLLDPATNNFSNFLVPGSTGTASNANCTLNAATSTVSTTTNQVQLGLGLTFTNSFIGSYRVTASVCDGPGGGTCTPDISIGTWQVPALPSIAAVIPGDARQGLLGEFTIVGTNTHFSNSSTVSFSGTGVTFTPTFIPYPTQISGTLSIDPSATASTRTVTVTTGSEVVTSSFTVDASGQVQLSSTGLTFGHQDPSTTSSAQPVMLTNNGHATLNISSILASNGFGVTHNCGSMLAVGVSCTLNITFQPTLFGTETGTVTLMDDSPTSPQTIGLVGYGNAVVTLSRPTRPTLSPSASARTGGISRAIFGLGDFGVTRTSDLVCQGSRRLTCSIESDESSDKFRIAIDATLARPGRYVLHVVAPTVPNAKTIRVPVLVKSRARPARPQR